MSNKNKLQWETKPYYHNNLKRTVDCLQKGGIGILSHDANTHIIILVEVEAWVLSDKQCLLGPIEQAKLLVEYMLSKHNKWNSLASLSNNERRKISTIIKELRDGGSFWFELDGEKKQIVLQWEETSV